MSQGSLHRARFEQKSKKEYAIENACHTTADSFLNKGTSFTEKEREELGLRALYPSKVTTLQEQMDTAYEQFSSIEKPLDKYIFLRSIQDENEVLYYALVSKHIEEMMPCIYTPTVGAACQNYSKLFLRPRGIYLSLKDKGNIKNILSSLNQKRVDVIVVTDGERILGLGDLGMGGMGIPIGKLALYSALGGVNPTYTLPITLDVGTNNEELLKDKHYLGIQKERARGKAYDEFLEEFVMSVKEVFPKVLLQWEDFAKLNAYPLLKKYQDVQTSFNDDIQGTASVVSAAIFAALKASNTSITDQRIVIFGGGSAGIGVADYVVTTMQEEGMSEQEARDRIYVLGRAGLAHSESDGVDELKKPYAKDVEKLKGWKVANINHITLEETVEHVKPTMLIGASTIPNSFTESIVKTMAKHVERPIIFPLSNPTWKAEAQPVDILKWTNGKALIGTGSPFPPVEYEGKTFHVGQCNNVYIFPGVGMGVIASESTKVTDEMFLMAAKKLSEYAPAINDPYGSLFPKLTELKVIAKEIALACGKLAIERGYSKMSESEFEKALEARYWEPVYPTLTKKQ